MTRRGCEEDEEDVPTMTESASVRSESEPSDDVPGFYIPDPESRSGFRIWWIKRPKPGGPPRRQMGFR